MAFEPPPDVLRADRMRKGQVGAGRVRTGAKTATKDQERDYLERFTRLAEDPSPLVPRWAGAGADPFASARRQLERVRSRRESAFWLKWYGRGRKLRSAYAQTLLILKGGRIPSFASIRLRGRDIKFILRGNGLRDKLVALHNWDEPDARLMAYLDVSKRKRLVIVSLPDDFFAVSAGGLPEGALKRILDEMDLEAHITDDGARCVHAAGRPVVEHELPALGVRIGLCRACGKRFHEGLAAGLEAYVLPPGGRFDEKRTVRGSGLTVHPESAREELERLVQQASRAAQDKSKTFEGVTDDDLLDWSDEAFQAALDARREGFLLLGSDLWLGDFAAAAESYGGNDLERRALRLAFARRAPRVRASDATLNRLLEDAWPEEGQAVLGELAEGQLDAVDLAPLAAQRPAEALAALDRLRAAEDRFAGFPRLGGLEPPLRLAHDLFKAHRTGDSSRFQRRLAEGVREATTKPLTLALARAFGQGAGIEWQYAPHEKDQALFFEPAAKTLAAASPGNYREALERLALALNVPPPQVSP